MAVEDAIDGDALFRLHRTHTDRGTIHGTAIALNGRGLLVLGGAGAGKTGLAAQLIMMGAKLVSDDVVVVTRTGAGLTGARPEHAPSCMELRGLGIVTVPDAGATALKAVLYLGASAARLPDDETITLLNCSLPLLRHPARHDTAAKVALWLTTT